MTNSDLAQKQFDVPQPEDVQRSMRVENVSLTLPTYGVSASKTPVKLADEHDDRLIYDNSGRLRAVSILKDISFELVHGDRLALLGVNGSGKTTLLQILAGAIPPSEGRVVYTGGAPTSLINIGLGMQMEATGHRNITLRGLLAGYSYDEIEAKRADICAFTELGEFLDMPVSTYSAGMKMRLSFAIVTSFDPEVLILDEWLSAGDTAFKEKASERMNEFAEKAGILVLASHNLPLLQKTCSKAIWLDQGRIVATGDVAEIHRDYHKEIHARMNDLK